MPVDTPTVSISSRERAAWFVLAILLLFSIAAPLNQFKKFEFRLSAAFDVPVFPP